MMEKQDYYWELIRSKQSRQSRRFYVPAINHRERDNRRMADREVVVG